LPRKVCACARSEPHREPWKGPECYGKVLQTSRPACVSARPVSTAAAPVPPTKKYLGWSAQASVLRRWSGGGVCLRESGA
ncbi:unnamed protein product, partial [Ectocarpus sp. 12 AP-2014]